MFTLMLMFIVFGLILAGISIPMILRRIPPNGLYGFRVKKTMENPEIWYKVNEHFGKRLFAASLIQVLVCVGLYFVPGLTQDTYSYAALAVWVVTFGFAMLASVRYLRSL